MNLSHFLKAVSLARSSQVAVTDGSESVTYEELWKRITRVGSALRKMGLKEGDRVIITLPNSIDSIVSFLAILSINSIAVPLKQVFVSYELRPILKEVKPAMFITTSAYLKRLLSFAPKTGHAGTIVVSTKKLVKQRRAPRYAEFSDLVTAGCSETDAPDELSDRLHDVATIHYTYRGLGFPLGAMLTHRNLIAGIETFVRTVGPQQGGYSLLCIPAAHVYPLISCVLAPLFVGGAVMISPAKSIRELIAFMQNGRSPIGTLAGVPTLYSEFAAYAAGQKHFPRPQINCSLSGGSLLPTEVYWRVKHLLGWDIRQGYGLTECLPVTCNPTTGNRPETLGRPGWGVRIGIVDPQSRVLPTGHVGEIAVSGPTVMAGYFRRKDATAQVMRNGWLHTGDLGLIDSDGYLYFRGLCKEVAKVGGNLVDLKEVEKTILRYPRVQNASVGTLFDKNWGQVVTAEVQLKPDGTEERARLRAFLRRRLASFKIPKLTFT